MDKEEALTFISKLFETGRKLSAENAALKAELAQQGAQVEENNPFCENCKEIDCIVSLDGTCGMIRKYLAAPQNSGAAANIQPTAAAAPLPPPAPLPESSVKAMLDAENLQFGR